MAKTVTEALAQVATEQQRERDDEVAKGPQPQVAPDAPAENVATFVMSGPSATSPVKGEEYQGAFAADFEKVEGWGATEVPESLPAKVRNSQDIKALNANARDNLVSVVLRPGHVFSAPGRYHDITNVEKKYDVEPGHKLPEDTYVVSERYLLSAYDRGVA